MSTLLTRRPRNDYGSMLDVFDRMFDSMWSVGPATNGGTTMPLDIYEKDNKVFLCASIPGIKPSDIEVSVDDDVLTIRGETKQTWESDEKTKVYRKEFRHGVYSRSIRLPEGLDLDKIEATFDNGLVTVSIPRSEPVRTEPRKIEVKTPQAIEGNQTQP
jgi:HSP20 family protein